MMAPALPPWRARNRLAEAILAALGDPQARRILARIAGDAEVARAWLAPEDSAHLEVVRMRAQCASTALAAVPIHSPSSDLGQALSAAAILFDAGLFFETHEVLEPHWQRASGETRDVVQGLIQIAVGYQHQVNGNARGARGLLAEGVARVRGRRLLGIGLDAFADAVTETGRRVDAVSPAAPRFPRFPQAHCHTQESP
jgi:hypothetical protein